MRNGDGLLPLMVVLDYPTYHMKPIRKIRPHHITLRVPDATYGLTASFRITHRSLFVPGVYAWTEATVYVPRKSLREALRRCIRRNSRPLKGRLVPYRLARGYDR
jgi:hypothetical protein